LVHVRLVLWEAATDASEITMPGYGPSDFALRRDSSYG